ncbi:MAG: 16S rRNA processing protein RimM [Crocinitomix sp.]|jgi:16S rRNA processing protein RimM
MFLKTDCYRLGEISKLHSYKGEVTIYLDVDDPLEYKDLESVFVEYGNKLVPFFLERIAIRQNGQAVVKFEDVDTERRAKTILKCGLYLPLDTLPELTDTEFYFHEIEGFSVTDEAYGPIGKVIHVIDQANNPLIAIEHEGQEILIPKQDQFIKNVDRENKLITIAAPEGLLDMYLASDEEE